MSARTFVTLSFRTQLRFVRTEVRPARRRRESAFLLIFLTPIRSRVRGLVAAASEFAACLALMSAFESASEEAAELFPSQSQLNHHPFLPFVVDQVMAMEQHAAVVLKVCACDSFAPRIIGIECRGQ